MDIVHVILSGGVGSRLWPLSRKSRPKQYISLFNGFSLFQLCVKRNLFLNGKMLIVGNKNNRGISSEHLEKIGIGNYTEIVEAIPRNTAAAITFAAFEMNPDDILLITPSDHVITHQKVYEDAVARAVSFAGQGYLVTFGIHPTRPETGFGYIKHQGNDVEAFVEKPNLGRAEEMLKEGGFLWNSGMFCFKAKVFLEEMQQYAPDVLKAAKSAWDERVGVFLPEDKTEEIPSISVDYAVMEHSKKIKVIPVEGMGWSDLGTFDSLLDYWKAEGLPLNDNKHLVLGAEKPVYILGEQELIFVETEDAVLLMPKGAGQKVKDLYERLEKNSPKLTE